MAVTRWMLAECEQLPDGRWFVSPSTVLPQGTYVRYFRSESDPRWALLRVTNDTTAQLDAAESALTTTGKINRLKRDGKKLGPLVNNARFKAFIDGLGVDSSQFSNNSTAIDILNAILAIHDPTGERRTQYTGGNLAVEE